MSWKARTVVTSALLLCACGASSPRTSRQVQPAAAQIVRPARPVWCPTNRSTLRQSEPNSRAAHSFDARTLLGDRAGQAAALVQRAGCLWRVIARDGRHFALTADIRLDRVDVSVDHGLVTSVGVY